MNFMTITVCSICRCEHGFLRLWDGLRQPGRYPFPPNTLCGDYNMGEIGVQKFSTQRLAEVEFLAQRGVRKSTFTLTYKYVNVGKFMQGHTNIEPPYKHPVLKAGRFLQQFVA